MQMYDLIDEKNIFGNLTDKERIFQLSEIPYNVHEKAVVDTMYHFTMKITEADNSRQTVPYERNRVLHKSDSDNFGNNANIISTEGTDMNW